MKRFCDIILVVMTSPVWGLALAALSLLVLVVEGRPVFFVQRRAGFRARAFNIWKLRTMRQGEGADAERMTKLGRFLRSTSLDELPQLLQVLAGKMSLVGPRPLPTRYLERYNATQARRHEVRPGITGWAQVNGRNAISWDEKFALDVWYVDNRSLWLDFKILALTVINIFKRSGIDSQSGETMEEFNPPPEPRPGEQKMI